MSTSKDPVVRLCQLLDYEFSDAKLLTQALTHRSFVNEIADDRAHDNERFEFLGDAVIDLVVSVALMKRFPDAREGALSKMRASVVSEKALARMARELQLGEALRLGRGEAMSGGRDKASILSDAFEAVMAAIYMDAGYAEAERVLLSRIELPKDGTLERRDPKTELQHHIQAEHHVTPVYRLVDKHGPEHERSFVVELCVN
ncbi:MAG: ribonuclease III, partial [Deltaproteobacteria bacterium]